MSEFILNERPFIKHYHKFLVIAQPILALMLLLMVIFEKRSGLSVIYILLIFALLINTIRLLIVKRPTISFTEDGIHIKDQTITYQDIDTITEHNSKLLFSVHGENKLILNEWRYEPDDLVKMNEYLGNYHLGVGDAIESFPLAKIDDERVSAKIMIILSVVALVYLLALGQDAVRFNIVFALLSLIIPLILFAYYSYLLYTNQIDHVRSHRAGFLLAMLFPVIIGWGVIYSNFTTGGVSTIIHATIIFFIVFLLYYYFENHIRAQGNDYLYLVFVIIYMPLLLLSINNAISVGSPVYETHTVSSVNVRALNVTTLYDFKYVTSKDLKSTVITSAQGKNKKAGDRVAIAAPSGFFGTYSDEITVKISRIKKVKSGYRIYYYNYHYNRISISEKEALKLKKNQKVKIRIRKGLFGVKDYRYIA